MAPRHLKSPSPSNPSTNGTTSTSTADVPSIVKAVIDDIRARGDAAVRQYSERFGRWSPASFKLSKADIEAAIAQVPEQTIRDIKEAQANVREFALAQKESLRDFEVELRPGVRLGQRNVPISRVGAYITGGRYPLLASAHMTILTAKVDFIAGPGNAFVAEAKRQLYGEIGIDLFAGPTEILIVADEHADPFTIATDLLSQAEHGPDSPAVLITTSESQGRQVIRYVDKLLEKLETAAIAGQSWKAFGEYAFEHVQVLTQRPREALEKMSNSGALFLGERTCVSYGDKVIGTNHVLPTRKAARYTGGLWVGKFLRTVTYQEVTSDEASGKLGQLCGRAARAELFEGHARSGDLRAHKYLNEQYAWIDHGKEVKVEP
ncbi:histidinol dehydrogenase-domain-containing protein [Thermoascus aurantiacus ATCC 26904]